MTVQGRPRTRFNRAIAGRNVFFAEVALGELEHVQLEDAVQMVILYAEVGDRKYELAAGKHLARWIAEEKPSLEKIAAMACLLVEKAVA